MFRIKSFDLIFGTCVHVLLEDIGNFMRQYQKTIDNKVPDVQIGQNSNRRQGSQLKMIHSYTKQCQRYNKRFQSTSMLVYLINTVLANAAEDIYVPDLYSVNGTFRIPLSNITQPFQAKIDLAKNMGFISYYDNLTFNVFTKDRIYHVFTKNNTKKCDHSFNGGINTGMTSMLPDLSKNWTELPQINIKGITCRHFRLKGIDGVQGNENDTYNFFETDQQDYYCINGTPIDNKIVCIPYQWVISGYNTNGGSHYDLYQIDYDSFDYLPTFNDSIFVKPEECEISVEKESIPLLFSTKDTKGFAEFLNFKAHFNNNTKYKPTFQIQYYPRIRDGYDNFVKQFTGRMSAKNSEKLNSKIYKVIEKRETEDALPLEFDLRTKGIMQPVKDQAVCGSCWTFGSGGTLEGRLNWNFRHQNKTLVKVSEQQILSCTWKTTGLKMNMGCNGGNHDAALEVLIEKFSGKVPMANKSPYLGYEGPCDSTAFTNQFGVISQVNVIKSSLPIKEKTQLLKEALLAGPVAVSIAVPKSLAYYSGGVYNDPACGYGIGAMLVHSVVAVGWGNDTELGPYWIIRNSWSSAWGQDGYVYIAMDNDLCGVLREPTYPNVRLPNDVPKYTDYLMKGTFELPYSNITQQMEVFYSEKNKQQVINWFNYSDYQVWDLKNDNYYGVLTYKPENSTESTQYCTLKPQLGLDNTQLLQMLPNLTQNWTEMSPLNVNGKKIRHFRLTQFDSNPPNIPRVFQNLKGDKKKARIMKDNDSFSQGRDDQQNFFCREESNGSCTPLKWDFFGYNTLQGSHYDYYVMNIDEFNFTSTYQNDSIFSIPTSCGKNDAPNGNKQKRPSNSKWMVHFSQITQNKSEIQTQNKKFISKQSKQRKYTLSPNKFISYDFKTFLNVFTGYKHNSSYKMKNIIKTNAEFDPNGTWYINSTTGIKTAFPKHIDWRARGGVGSVRDQANCGSCWSFGTAAAIETRLNILNNDTKKPNIQVSEQSIVDCIWSDTLNGCDGGFAVETLDRIIKDYNGYIATTNDYPYFGQDLKCNNSAWNNNKDLGRILGYNVLNSTGALKYALLKGPITAAIQVTPSMMFYSGGIFDDPDCQGATEFDLNHQITVVGYNVLDGVEYFIVRNSWSAAWGQDGHIYLPAHNDCGLKLQGVEVLVVKDEN